MERHRIVRSVAAGTFAIVVGGALAWARGPAATPVATDFAREVQPILAASCVRCHAAGLAQGQLRLDTREGLLQGGASGPVVLPGNGQGSPLYQRLILDDPQKRMPWLSDPLSPAQVETLRRWIDAGAPWPEGVTVEPGRARRPPCLLPRPASSPRSPSDGPAVTFNKDVRPILAANCYACHGPDRNNRQAGLRLDREEVAKAALASGHVAIVPGAPEKSALIQRITDPDEQKRMPHVSSGKERLGRAQIETLTPLDRAGGAVGAALVLHPPREGGAARGEERRLGQGRGRRVHPRRDGEAGSLALRRSRAERAAAPGELRPRGPAAHPRGDPRLPRGQGARAPTSGVVDRLLASPRFGERMAMSWLDLVRYADSVGYHSDNSRVVWRYRDYVIDAFNRNLPFDRFTAEQLAGDLLPGPTTEQKIASGYNRLLQTTEEGGAQPKEYRAIYLADRVRNASTVWLGATLGCAQCHDHKFDPYLARDFYSFGAFFADVKEKPVGRREPELPARREAAAAPGGGAGGGRRASGRSFRRATPEREAAQARWEPTLAGEARARPSPPWSPSRPRPRTAPGC